MARKGHNRDELPLAERDLPSQIEIEQEVMGRFDRDLIALHAITDADFSLDPELFLVDTEHRQKIAKMIARYFHRETPWDLPPYSPGDESDGMPVWLIRSQRVATMVPLAAGALGMRLIGDQWALKWICIHPWERGRLGSRSRPTVEVVFDELDERYGEFLIEGPVSKAMRALMSKRGYDPTRII